MFSRMHRGNCKSFQMPEIWVETCALQKPPAWRALTPSGVCRSIRAGFCRAQIIVPPRHSNGDNFMKRKMFAVCTLTVLMPILSFAQNKEPLKQVATIPLPGLKDGDFDHFTPDLDGHRLFLTDEENNKVDILDTNANKRIHTIEEAKAPHAILYRKDLKKLFVVEGDASEVKTYDSDTFKPQGAVKVSIDADSIAYDPATSHLYVVNGGREAKTPYSLISVIDTSSEKKLRDIKIPNNHVEAITLEKSGPRMFINITGNSAVGVMDRNKSELSTTWPLPAGDKANVAMAFDEPNHRLFIVTREPGKLIVMNSDDGKVIAELPAVAMVDDAVYDAQHKRIYLAGDGALEVFQQKDADHYELLAKIPTGFRAKTGVLVPEWNRYYLGVPHHAGKDAEVRVYEVQP
jgi:DNA-binding beta-propeller fold protein YncE